MKTTMFLKAIFGLAVAVSLTLTVTPVLVSGQDAKVGRALEPLARQGQAGSLEGTWRTEVTVRNCETGEPIRTFQALHAVLSGGSMLETATNSNLRSPGHGIWEPIGGRDFTTTFMFFTFNPDGTFAGTTRVTRDLELSEDSNEFTATDSIKIFDVSGKLVETRCATETAQRFE